MAETKDGREKQARNAEKRQREREITEARDRADEVEPEDDWHESDPNQPTDTGADSRESPSECHRRGCTQSAAFVVRERYQEETGKGAVEATARLCREHTGEESPVNLDAVYDEYVFRVDPLPGATGSGE